MRDSRTVREINPNDLLQAAFKRIEILTEAFRRIQESIDWALECPTSYAKSGNIFDLKREQDKILGDLRQAYKNKKEVESFAKKLKKRLDLEERYVDIISNLPKNSAKLDKADKIKKRINEIDNQIANTCNRFEIIYETSSLGKLVDCPICRKQTKVAYGQPFGKCDYCNMRFQV